MSPLVTVDELNVLLEQYAAEFSSMDVLSASWEALKAWCSKRRLPITLEGARTWLERDLAQDQVFNIRVAQALSDPLAEAHPSTYELEPHLEGTYIARGDLHDWIGIDVGTHEEAVARHAEICRRCQMGIESRRKADEIARARGKKPFPGLGKALRVARKQFEPER